MLLWQWYKLNKIPDYHIWVIFLTNQLDEIGEKQLSVFSFRGGQISPLIHVAQNLWAEPTNIVFRGNGHDLVKLLRAYGCYINIKCVWLLCIIYVYA